MPYEEFHDFTLAGAESTKITAHYNYYTSGNWTNTMTTYLYDDKGVDFFSGDFTHLMTNLCTTSALGCRMNIWMISNALDDAKGLEDASADFQFLESYGLYGAHTRMRLGVCEGGSITIDTSINLPESVYYYITLTRDDDGGANSTGQLQAVIRTDSHEGTIVDTLTVDCAAGEQNDFRYYFPACSWNGTGAGSMGVSSRNISLDDGASYESLEDYTLEDPSSIFSNRKDRGIYWGLVYGYDECYAYKDYGVDHFDEDWDHIMQFEVTTENNNPIMALYFLTNDLAAANPQTDVQGFYYQNDNLYLWTMEADSSTTDGPVALRNDGTVLYVTFERDDDGGANETGRLTAYYRIDSHEGALQDTHTIDCGVGQQNDWRYILCPASWDDYGGANSSYGWITRLDLQEIVGYPYYAYAQQ